MKSELVVSRKKAALELLGSGQLQGGVAKGGRAGNTSDHSAAAANRSLVYQLRVCMITGWACGTHTQGHCNACSPTQCSMQLPAHPPEGAHVCGPHRLSLRHHAPPRQRGDAHEGHAAQVCHRDLSAGDGINAEQGRLAAMMCSSL